MDFNNVSELLNGMVDFYDTHRFSDINLFVYDPFELTNDPDPRLKALADKDKYGEYLGQVTRSWCPAGEQVDHPGQPKINNITVYLRQDNRPAAVWNNIGNISDAYEIFDYRDGYYISAQYSFLMKNELHQNFIYYLQREDGKVKEMISIYGGMICLDGNYANITRTILDYNGDETILVSSNNYRYKKTDSGYVLAEEYDNIKEPDPEDRVVDDQEELCNALQSKIKDTKNLEEIVRSFFEVIATAEPNPEELIEYSAGTYPLSFPGSEPFCVFTLMRQTPDEEDEFYQLVVEVSFDTNEEIPFDSKFSEEGDDMLDFILNSESFKAFKGKRITEIDIRVDQT